MAGTKLIRKKLKNRVVSKKRTVALKRVMKKPLITNVDVEQIKEEFAKKKAATTKKEAPIKEVKVVDEVAAPAAEPKKAAPKAKKEKNADAE